MPNHTFGNSNMLASCEHEGDCMIVTFKNGAKYRYKGVPVDAYHELTKADSAGSHFGQHVRGKYPHERIEE